MKQTSIGIIFSSDLSKVLLVKRRDVPVWVLPGGGIEVNERPMEAVVREVQEETGYQVNVMRKTGEYTPINRLTNLTHVYQCLPVGGKQTISSETCDIGYFPLDNLPWNIFFLHKDWIGDAKANELSVIRKPIHQVTYLRFFFHILRYPTYMFRYLLSKIGMPINTRNR